MNNKGWITTLDFEKNKFLIENLRLLIKNWEITDKSYEYLFVIGGDGTIIKKLKENFNKHIKIIGINSGKHTFIGQCFSETLIKNDIYQEKNYSNYQIIVFQDEYQTSFGINDVFISGNLFLECEIYINDEFFQLFRGYGLLLSSFLGCTAFNKALLNSPIILPELKAWIINPLFGQINNQIISLSNPIILSEKDVIKLKILNKNFNVFVDNEQHKIDNNSKNFLVKINNSNSKIFFPSNNKEYLNKLQKHFTK